jgi:hypothetical protein
VAEQKPVNFQSLSSFCWQIPKKFRCPTEPNAINLSCFCWQIFKFFAAWLNKRRLNGVGFAGKFENFRCAAEQNTDNYM